MSSPLRNCIVFQFLAFFLPVMVVSYTCRYRSFPKPYRCSIQSLKAIGLWLRPETFETETRKNGFRDQDQVSRLHHLGAKLVSFLRVTEANQKTSFSLVENLSSPHRKCHCLCDRHSFCLTRNQTKQVDREEMVVPYENKTKDICFTNAAADQHLSSSMDVTSWKCFSCSASNSVWSRNQHCLLQSKCVGGSSSVGCCYYCEKKTSSRNLIVSAFQSHFQWL